ncbi:MAG TPA: hypothetical protein VFC78_06265 [Tepidisphaeraceae bacterium]|nr:hypothetical protein [Tepidisphaeraceae bacterium]
MWQSWLICASGSTPEFSLFWVSVWVLGTLAVVFAASCAIFYTLVSRSTSNRQWVALCEWGKDRGFRLRRGPVEETPPPFDGLGESRPSIDICMIGRHVTLLRAHSPPSAPGTASSGRTASIQATSGASAPAAIPHGPAWNLLIRPLEHHWPPTGLRPTRAAQSVVELFALTSFPLLGDTERFVLYGTDSAAAAALSRSAARGLLPLDVGLLLHRKYMVLDFSPRPFDEIEFERMIVVAQQLVAHLPRDGEGDEER